MTWKMHDCWFGEQGCHDSSKMESGSWTDCCQSGVNRAPPFMRINPDQNWMMILVSTNKSVLRGGIPYLVGWLLP